MRSFGRVFHTYSNVPESPIENQRDFFRSNHFSVDMAMSEEQNFSSPKEAATEPSHSSTQYVSWLGN
jgi:hypothetical protein